MKLKVYKKKWEKKEVKNLLKLEEWAEEKDSVMVIIYEDKRRDSIREEKPNRKLRELQVSMLYNPRYLEEKESYVVNLKALRSYFSLSHSR